MQANLTLQEMALLINALAELPAKHSYTLLRTLGPQYEAERSRVAALMGKTDTPQRGGWEPKPADPAQ